MQVTVLMSVYNEKDTIEQAIKSIVDQTYTEWSMLIIDDFSADGTYELSVRMAARDERIEVFRNKSNLGLAASLNLGIHKINSDFIARMDGDDISMPSRLTKQVSFLLANPDIDVVGTGAELLGENDSLQNIILLPEAHADLEKCILSNSVFFHPSVMMRKSFLIETGGYNEKLLRAQDLDLWMNGLKNGARYHNIQEALIRYRTGNYQRSLKTITSQFRTRIYLSFKYGFYLSGNIYAFIDFVKNIFIMLGLYIPRSLRNGSS